MLVLAWTEEMKQRKSSRTVSKEMGGCVEMDRTVSSISGENAVWKNSVSRNRMSGFSWV